jgi:hypothetical protein
MPGVFTNEIIIIGVITLIIIFGVYLAHNSGLFDGGRALVIVEPREHRLLKYVCDNFDKNILLIYKYKYYFTAFKF